MDTGGGGSFGPAAKNKFFGSNSVGEAKEATDIVRVEHVVEYQVKRKAFYRFHFFLSWLSVS